MFATDSIAVDPATWTDLQNLYARLHLVEKLETELSRDLLTVLQQLNRIDQPVNITVATQDAVPSASTGNAFLSFDLYGMHTSIYCIHVCVCVICM